MAKRRKRRLKELPGRTFTRQELTTEDNIDLVIAYAIGQVSEPRRVDGAIEVHLMAPNLPPGGVTVRTPLAQATGAGS